MNKAGFSFIAAGVLLYLAASQTQIGWLYLFDALIWSLLLLSVILSRHSLKSLSVECQVLMLTPVFRQPPLGGPLEDEVVEVKIRVSNNGRLGRYFIKVLADCPFAQPEQRQQAFFLIGLKPRSTTAFSNTVTCYRRGYYTSLIITLQSSGLLGLLVRRRSFDLPLNLLVYPAYYQMEEMPLAGANWMERGHPVKSAAATEFYGSREYQYGDPLRHIHWRNTARVGHFMLKEFERASQGSVAVVFGTGRDFGEGRETTLEYSIRIAASLARLCADSGYSIDISAGKGTLHNADWREAMDYLARLEVGGKVTSGSLPAVVESGQSVVVIVPAAERELVPSLALLAKRVPGLVLVLLEGFVPGEMPEEFLAGLKGSGARIVICSKGNLEAAIKELSRSPVLAGGLANSVDWSR